MIVKFKNRIPSEYVVTNKYITSLGDQKKYL